MVQACAESSWHLAKSEYRCIQEDRKTFGELIEHFVIGGDETNLIADADGSMRIIGKFGRQKHRKKIGDCHASCTMYRTGMAGGNNSQTVFVMASKQRHTGYTDKFLVDNGCEVGPTVQMNEKAFMAEECWLNMTPCLVHGYRSLPFIRDNPQ